MKLNNLNNALSLFVLLAVLLPQTVISQKKKRGEDSPQGIRLREAEFYFTEGEKFFILEDYAKALVYYQRAQEINPDNGTIHYKIAEVLSKSSTSQLPEGGVGSRRIGWFTLPRSPLKTQRRPSI